MSHPIYSILPWNSLKNYNISYDPASLQIDTNETIHNVNLHNISLRIFMDIGLKNVSVINNVFAFIYLVRSIISYAICTYLLSRGKSRLTWRIFGYSMLLVTYIFYIYPRIVFCITLHKYFLTFSLYILTRWLQKDKKKSKLAKPTTTYTWSGMLDESWASQPT